MSIELMSAAWRANLPTGRKIVLLSLCDNANDQGECYPSIATISARCGVGERSVYRYIDEFEQVGAVRRENRVGRSTIYHIDASKFGAFLTPATVAPTPATVAPPVPATVAPITIIEPSKNQIPNTTRAQKNGAIACAIFSVDDVDADVWSDFVKLRKAKKSPLTKTAVDGIRREAERAGWTMQAAIAECCARGWSGFKAAWVADKSSLGGTGAHAAEPAWRAEQRQRTQQAVPSIAEKPLQAQQSSSQFFDVEAKNVTAVALG